MNNMSLNEKLSIGLIVIVSVCVITWIIITGSNYILEIISTNIKCTNYCESQDKFFGYTEYDYCVCRERPHYAVKLEDLK